MQFSPLIYLRRDTNGVPFMSIECMGCDRVLFTIESEQTPISVRSIERDARELNHICEEEE